VQISTVHKLQHTLDGAIKVLRVVWRHVLTIAVIGMVIYGICAGKVPVIDRITIIFATAAFIDWFKMKLPFKAASNQHFQTSSIPNFSTNYHEIGVSSPWYRYETLGISRYNY
jgi:hypothetical protein